MIGLFEESASIYYNLEAEQCLIGIAISEPKHMKLVTETSADDFYDQRNKVIQAALRDMEQAGTTVDLVTLDDWLVKHKQLDEAGGDAYLMECIQKGFLTSQAQNYLKIIRECAMRRALYRIGKELMEKTNSADSPEDIRDWASRTVKDLRLGDVSQVISMWDACINTYTQLGEDQQKPGEPSKKILSGIATLDNKLGGLRGGEYVAIGARPSVGKSILALTFCVNAAMQGKRVLLVSLEMNEVQITERVLADKASVPLNMITSGNIDEDGWMKLTGAVSPVAKLPLWYSLEATTVEKVRRCAYQLYENGGLDMIAIDYLQLMEATYAKKQSRQEQISEISRGLRKLAAELKIPILVLTQLNRSSVNERVDGKKVKREPTMSEARESGAIEQDANVFILLHNPGKDEMRDEAEREVWENLDKQGYTMMRLIIDKNRQGKRGRMTVAFDGDHMRFLPIVRNA
ncbi:MAG: AAA family ATPase [Clostridia bacterium]|nr:AAA family ATPase [Clostridia bacterium]